MTFDNMFNLAFYMSGKAKDKSHNKQCRAEWGGSYGTNL